MKKIKLMADYHCYPIWDMQPNSYGDIDPRDLPISQELTEDLLAWAISFDLTLNSTDPLSSGFKSAEEASNFKSVGHQLCERLKNELGADYFVTIKV
jgi:hypothetical protein